MEQHNHTHNHGSGYSAAERLTLLLSGLCAIHCLATPFILVGMSLFPSLGSALQIGILQDERWELAIIGGTAILGYFTMWHGFRHHHKRRSPLVWFSVGIALFLFHHFVFSPQAMPGIVLAVISSLIIVISQVLNYRYTQKYSCK